MPTNPDAPRRSNDRQLRQAVLAMLAIHPEDPSRRLIQEFWIPLSHERADLVEVNGVLTGYEIKSGLDTLRRLPRQAVAFSAVLDKVSLVCDPRHLCPAQTIVPQWWGLLSATDTGETLSLQVEREATINPVPDPERQLRLLWKAELARGLRSRGLDLAGLDRNQMRQALMRDATLAEISQIVRSALLARPASAGRW